MTNPTISNGGSTPTATRRGRGAHAVKGSRKLRFNRLGKLWPALRPFMPAGRREFALLSLSSIVAGFSQAGVLYIVVEVALALAKGSSTVSAHSSVFGGATLNTPTAILIGFGLVGVLVLASLTQALLGARMTSAAQTEARRQLLGTFLESSWELQSTERLGHLQELVTTYANRVADSVTLLVTGVVAFFNFAALMVVAVVVNPAGTGIIIAGVVFISLLLRPLARATRASAAKQVRANAEYAVRTAGVVRLAQEIRVFHAVETVRSSANEAALEAQHSLTRTRFLLRSLPNLYQATAMALVLAAVTAVYFAHVSTVGGLGAVVLLLVRGMTYSQTLQGVHTAGAEVVNYLDELHEWQARYSSHRVIDGYDPIDDVDSIEFREVFFSYTDRVPVLHGVSFRIERGKSTGIVGPSGAGKSTLVQLLLRLRHPASGSYALNGIDADSYLLGDFYRQVAFVPQDPKIVRGSVRDNIVFFRDDITDESIERAARLAQLHDDICSWTGAYDHEIGDGANDLSGGQKQRLAIARALAGNPSVVILDEPTSALDARSDHLVRQSLEELKQRLTLLIVAHRLSTLEFCDQIMVLEHGRVTAFGPPSEIAETNQYFMDARRLSSLS